MFFKTVIATIIIDSCPVEISISVGCIPETPDSELIRQASKILRAAANDATYKVL